MTEVNEAGTAEGQETPQTAEQPGVEKFSTKADKSDGAREIEMEWNVGKDIDESVEIFGAEVVHSQFRKSIVIAAQATIRRMLLARKEDGSIKYSDEEIVTFIHNNYKPGVRQAREGGAKGMDKVIAYIMKLSETDRLEFLKDPKAFMAAHK